ncbi:AAA family ATPase [Rubellicoccus peritrichatus]|uniref:AAA family ATPase n=1 Tax=Rubellicoccus peritrichatus TaxID=3080537 RepID=A0AAQ3LD51_9BACT|nr:AAA family ATPase [Puniceicoccus sp. CR14]WOO41695.1 AAA family ATPase [Puniceicoccus sp. CR14]
MPSKSDSTFPITQKDLREHLDHANQMLLKIQDKPATKPEQPSASKGNWRPSTDYSSSGLVTVELHKLAKVVSQDALILTPEANAVIAAFRDGACLGMHLGRAYGEAAGLERLIQLNRSGRMSAAQQAEFYEKHHTAAAVTLFGFAAYINWKLSSLSDEKIASRQITLAEQPSVDLANPLKALERAIFDFGLLSKDPQIRDSLDWYRYAQVFADALISELQTRVGSLNHTAFFTDNSYRLENTTLLISGFENIANPSATSVEFNRVEFKDIVGNREAKHVAMRTAQRLLCYDLTAKKNPFRDIGGLPLVRMGYGKPGTGKSLQIAAIATLLHDYCDWLEIPFLFWPLPDNIVSTFQGGSAERGVEYMRRLQDDDKILYAAIDDAENNFEERTRQGVSSGVREIIGVFLRYTEGAYAITRGNAVIDFYTNLPEQIDKAVLSRVQSRFAIDGAASREDFLDQDHLWWRKIKEVDPKVIAQKDPDDYEYLSAQAELGNLSELESNSEPQIRDDRLQEVTNRLLNDLGTGHHDFFARFFTEVLKVYPIFSSRDVRNIQQAVNNRLTDFDLPESWLETPETFFRQSYDRKLEMLKELMRGNMKSLTFPDIRWRETVKYCNNLSRILNQDRERRIADIMNEMDCHGEAKRRFVSTEQGS